MDIDFWETLAKNDFKIPKGHTLDDLTKKLLSYIGSTDPELRDDVAYIVYANFLKREMLSADIVRGHVLELLGNLENGIGEADSDSVFLRAFSILLLAEIVYNDNKKPLLEQDQIRTILEKGLWYLDAEKDPRGYVPIKGWAHALAHTADLMLELGKSRHLEKEDLEKILNGLANKLVQSTNWVYIHGEDERLANAVIAILEKNLIQDKFLEEWFKTLIEPKGSWKGAYLDEGKAKAYHNVRNFVRSVQNGIRRSGDLSQRENLQNMVNSGLDELKPH